MTTDAIIRKYWRALDDLTHHKQDAASDDAILLAISLAVQDAYAAGLETGTDLAAIVASQDKALQNALNQIDQLREERNVQPDQRYHEYLQAQISRLNEWLAEKAPALYRKTTDTATAVLAAINEFGQMQEDLDSARSELTRLIAERDGLRQQLAQMDADNARLITSLATHTNGNGANPTTTPDWNRDHPAWTALPAADLDVIDQLSSGLTTFRRLSRTLRRDLVLRVIRHLAAVHGEIKLSLYDAGKPPWMPTAGAVVTLSDTGRWPDLVTMALEPATA